MLIIVLKNLNLVYLAITNFVKFSHYINLNFLGIKFLFIKSSFKIQ